MTYNFVTLHNHTEFSSLDGFSRIKDVLDESGEVLVQGMTSKLKELNQTKCAITDHGTLSAIQAAYTSFSKEGIQLIPGCEFYVVEDVSQQKGFQNHLIVLPKNKIGWENILKMNYLSFEKGRRMIMDRMIGRISLDILKEHREGLIICSACLAGIPSQHILNERWDETYNHIALMNNLFPESYFLEMQCVDYYKNLDPTANTLDVDREWITLQAEQQKLVNDSIITLSKDTNTPIVLTLDSHYVNKRDRDVHLLMLAVQSKSNIYARSFSTTNGQGGKLAFEATPMLSSKEIIEVATEKESGFNGYSLEQAEEWIKNTSVVAELCSPPDYLKSSGYKIPLFPVDQSKDYNKFNLWKSRLTDQQKQDIIEGKELTLTERLNQGEK